MRPGSTRNFPVHMVWYSQNVRPLLLKSDPHLTCMPLNRLIRVDVMWVWTAAFGEYLAAIGIHAEMHSVGPILWRMPYSSSVLSRNELTIAVFDVTPVTEAAAVRLGLVDNYYSPRNAVKFLKDIVEVSRIVGEERGCAIRIVLKHKRAHQVLHDPEYINVVQSVAQAEYAVTLLPAQASLFEIIATSDLVISIPYSSPVYVASHLQKASAYYDPTGEIRPTFEPAVGLSFVSTTSDLKTLIENAVERRACSPV